MEPGETQGSALQGSRSVLKNGNCPGNRVPAPAEMNPLQEMAMADHPAGEE